MSEMPDKVIAVSKPYFGPATESFLNRQRIEHLSIGFAALEQSHLKELAKRVETSAKLIMAPEKTTEVAKRISRL